MLRETANAFVRVAAAKALLDRGWGRPVQPIESGDGGPAQLINQIQRIIVYPNRPYADDAERVGEASTQEALPENPTLEQKLP
jgi:hypothetical protein